MIKPVKLHPQTQAIHRDQKLINSAFFFSQLWSFIASTFPFASDKPLIHKKHRKASSLPTLCHRETTMSGVKTKDRFTWFKKSVFTVLRSCISPLSATFLYSDSFMDTSVNVTMLECVTSLFTRHEPERMPRVNRGACAELDRAQALCELLDSPENAPDSNNHCAFVIWPSQLLISNKIKTDLCSFPIPNLARCVWRASYRSLRGTVQTETLCSAWQSLRDLNVQKYSYTSIAWLSPSLSRHVWIRSGGVSNKVKVFE